MGQETKASLPLQETQLTKQQVDTLYIKFYRIVPYSPSNNEMMTNLCVLQIILNSPSNNEMMIDRRFLNIQCSLCVLQQCLGGGDV